jgi:hypothetical protein
MNEILFFLAIVGIGFFGAFMGSITSAVAIFTVPFTIFLGLSPQVAIATNKMGSFGLRLGGLKNLNKHKKIIWDLVFPMAIASILGSIIGANILVKLNNEFLSKIIGVVILATTPLFLFNRNLGTRHQDISKFQRRISHFFLFLIEIWRGIFGIAAGIFNVFLSTKGYGLTILEHKGTTRIPKLFGDIFSVIVYLVGGIMNLKVGFYLMIGMYFGSHYGSHFIIKKGDAWVKISITIFVIIMALKLIFF